MCMVVLGAHSAVLARTRVVVGPLVYVVRDARDGISGNGDREARIRRRHRMHRGRSWREGDLDRRWQRAVETDHDHLSLAGRIWGDGVAGHLFVPLADAASFAASSASCARYSRESVDAL